MDGLPCGATRHLDWLRGETTIAQRANLAVLASLADKTGSIGSIDSGTAKVVCVPCGREVASLARNRQPGVGDKLRWVKNQISGSVERGKALADELIGIRQEAQGCVG